jgi:HKD family nuclease
MFRTIKQKTIAQLENLKEHCDEMSKIDKLWESDVVALGVAIECLKNDRNEMIVNDIKRIIKRYDEMNLSVSFEERKENHIKAYMEIKDYFNNYAAEETK